MRTHLAPAAVLLAAAVLAGCEIGAQSAQPREHAQEALLAHLMTRVAPPGERPVCAAVRTGEGTGELETLSRDAVLRLEAHATSVLPGDECALESPVGSIVHTPTGQPAVLYEVQLLSWGDHESQLRGTWYRAALEGGSCVYIARDTGGVWEFTESGECLAM